MILVREFVQLPDFVSMYRKMKGLIVLVRNQRKPKLDKMIKQMKVESKGKVNQLNKNNKRKLEGRKKNGKRRVKGET
ncbi:hypothetical protein [Oceanobacillus massiliensis]|uniref:hypothetical protein n=1 Tax=Oceanobacillus massiliensis TaxID=1465765 RepID=UPI0030192CB2